jgi:hypothetical protein
MSFFNDIQNKEDDTAIIEKFEPANVRDDEARKSWRHYQDLYLNFFLYFSNNRFESPYYTALWYFLSGLLNGSLGKEYKKTDKWKLSMLI